LIFNSWPQAVTYQKLARSVVSDGQIIHALRHSTGPSSGHRTQVALLGASQPIEAHPKKPLGPRCDCLVAVTHLVPLDAWGIAARCNDLLRASRILHPPNPADLGQRQIAASLWDAADDAVDCATCAALTTRSSGQRAVVRGLPDRARRSRDDSGSGGGGSKGEGWSRDNRFRVSWDTLRRDSVLDQAEAHDGAPNREHPVVVNHHRDIDSCGSLLRRVGHRLGRTAEMPSNPDPLFWDFFGIQRDFRHQVTHVIDLAGVPKD